MIYNFKLANNLYWLLRKNDILFTIEVNSCSIEFILIQSSITDNDILRFIGENCDRISIDYDDTFKDIANEIMRKRLVIIIY